MTQFCITCDRGFFDPVKGRVICGAPVDDLALRGGGGVNPVWAERKYGPARLLALLSGVPGDGEYVPGMEHDDMRPSDGENCKMWRQR